MGSPVFSPLEAPGYPDHRSPETIITEAEARQMLPVFRLHPDTGALVEAHMRWGLIPHDAHRRPHVQPIHARAEGIHEQPLFREAYRRRRCIVPMSRYYQKDARGRRHTIMRGDRELFGAAGIWENWRDPDSGTWERTFAIVTVEANALVKTIHERMMLILDRGDFQRWMGPEDDPRDLLKPCPADILTVSPGVGARRGQR